MAGALRWGLVRARPLRCAEAFQRACAGRGRKGVAPPATGLADNVRSRRRKAGTSREGVGRSGRYLIGHGVAVESPDASRRARGNAGAGPGEEWRRERVQQGVAMAYLMAHAQSAAGKGEVFLTHSDGGDVGVRTAVARDIDESDQPAISTRRDPGQASGQHRREGGRPMSRPRRAEQLVGLGIRQGWSTRRRRSGGCRRRRGCGRSACRGSARRPAGPRCRRPRRRCGCVPRTRLPGRRPRSPASRAR